MGHDICETLTRPDFKKLDLKTNFNFREELYQTIDNLGYEYVSECVFDMYVNQKLSTIKIAPKLGKTKMAVNSWLRSWGIPLRDRGGNNIRPDLKDESYRSAIRQFALENSMTDAAREFHCGYQTVRRIMKEAA
jgi:hypothetical protein